jgi:hypothetical protein
MRKISLPISGIDHQMEGKNNDEANEEVSGDVASVDFGYGKINFIAII